MENRIQKGLFTAVKGYNSFLYGFFRLITIGTESVLSRTADAVTTSMSTITDKRKIQSDYKKIGNDMRKAVSEYERTKQRYC